MVKNKSDKAKDKKKILKILKKTCGHAFLATVDGIRPWVRSVSPIIGNNLLSIWISTYVKSRKVKQIKKNPNVCLHFAKQPDGSMVATVHGRAKIVRNIKDKKRVWKLAQFDMKQYFPDGPESKNFCLLRIVPNVIEWWDSWTAGRRVTTV